MNKLPVGQAIRFAYAFTFGQIGTVIGLIWIPTLIGAVTSFFATGAYYRAMADLLENAAPPSSALALPFLMVIVATLVNAIAGVAIVREALAPAKGPVFAHVSLGSAELRVFGAMFTIYMLLVVGLVLFSFVGSALAGIAAASGSTPQLMALPVAGAAVAALGALFYGGVRLSFLMIPAALDGGEFGLTKSWELTHGNFWRILAIGLTTMGPILLIAGIVGAAILGPDIFTPDLAPAKDKAADLHRMAAQLRSMQAHLPLLMGVNFVFSPLMYGLLFAPAAFAWRALTGKAVVEHTE